MLYWIRLLCSLIFFVSCISDNVSHYSQKPNILFFITDDQSYEHTSQAGCTFIQTPHFDRIANEGVMFTNAYVASPGCSPSRASILTGRYPWQIEEAGTHASSFPAKYKVYTDILEDHGYFVGYTGKGWGPGNWDVSGRKRNPAGKEFNQINLEKKIYTGISGKDYVANFQAFLEANTKEKPFCFWLGTHEPHRVFELDSYKKKNKKLETVRVPDFLPDTKEIRGDLLDYALEIEYADHVLGQVMEILESKKVLGNTFIVVTSDNGMAFPRAKANAYDHGIHVPMAMRWGDNLKRQIVHEPISTIDLAPTYLELAGIEAEWDISGQSLLPLLQGKEAEFKVKPVFSARERHSSSRYQNWTYPQRAIRNGAFLYIYNFKPDRWPAGDPMVYSNDGTLIDGFHDIDACPTFDFLLEHREDPEYGKYFHWAVDKRSEEELYHLEKDPYCLENLAIQPVWKSKTDSMKNHLRSYLSATGDPRMFEEEPDIFETYPRLTGKIRKFPDPNH